MIERLKDLWLSEDESKISLQLSQLPEQWPLSVDELVMLFELPMLWKNRFLAVFEFTYRKEIFRTRRFESLIWALSESLRQTLRAKKERKDPRIASAIACVCRDKSLQKGRESFVMLFGDLQIRGHEALLRELLDEDAMAGHAVLALRKLGVMEARAEVTRLSAHPKAWVRKEVRKYLQKAEGIDS